MIRTATGRVHGASAALVVAWVGYMEGSYRNPPTKAIVALVMLANRLRDGSPAVSLHRQQRGVVETATGRKVAMNGDVPGMADLGGTLTMEWGFMEGCACGKTAAGTVVVRCPHCNYAVYVPQRLQIYIEIEVKLDGKIPPQAREYTGTSRRQLTDTERQQVQRQQAQLARGGCYIFADRVVDAVEAVVRYRDDVLARIGA